MGVMRSWGLWLCVAVGLALAAWSIRLPAPRPAKAPADAFSAARAFPIVQEMAREPHAIGSAANARVRDALLRRMTALGLQPQVQAGIGIAAGRRATGVVQAGRVENLIGVLPGRDRALPPLLLMAHYDSVPGSPGAADDATGVASVLETVRALEASGPHRRDVVVAITDGEEAGLLGAELFFRANPLAARVGAVINAEARGDAGRVSMFETGPGNAGMVRLFARTAEHPYADSLTSYLYAQLPNDTDFTHVVRRRLPGLNLAFLGDQLAYHTALSTPEHLDKGSLQHMGGQILGPARALADAATIPPVTHDLVYADTLPGLPMLIYPPAAGWIPVVLAAALLAVALLRRGDMRLGWGELGRGFAVSVAATAGAASLLLGVGWALAPGGLDELRLYRLLGPYGWLFAGAALVTLAAALAPFRAATAGRGGRRWAIAIAVSALPALLRLDTPGVAVAVLAMIASTAAGSGVTGLRALWTGAVALGVILAAGVQALAPPAAILFAWPALAGALGLALTVVAPGRVAAVASGALAVLALTVLGGWASQVFAALGPPSPVVLALFVPLLLPSFAPLLAAWAEARAAWPTVVAALALGGLALAWVVVAPPSVARPALTRADALADPAAGVARVAPGAQLDAWSRQVLGAGARRIKAEPVFGRPVWETPAGAATPVPPPELALAPDGAGTRITARATGGGRSLRLYLRSPAGPEGARLDGLPVGLKAKPNSWSVVGLDAPGAAPMIVVVPGRGVEAVLVELREGWPPGVPVPSKPPGLIGSRDSDLTYAVERARGP